MLGACGSSSSSSTAPKGGATGTAPNPGTGTTATAGAATSTNTQSGTPTPGGPAATPTTPPGTPTPAGPPSTPPTVATPTTPAPVVSEFLAANQLPGLTTYAWSREYITPVHVEEPLVPVCSAGGGTELNTDVWDALYPSADHKSSAEEVVHTFASASYAASRLAAFYPKCSGVTAHTADGFAWRSTNSDGSEHILYARWNNKIATLTISMKGGDYDASLDAGLLATMTQLLKNS